LFLGLYKQLMMLIQENMIIAFSFCFYNIYFILGGFKSQVQKVQRDAA